MAILTIAIIIIVLAIASFIIYRFISVKKSGKILSQKKFERIQSIYE